MYPERFAPESFSESKHTFVTGVTSTANMAILTNALDSSRSWQATREIWAVSDRDPLIPGTRIPIYRVAALLEGGMTLEQVAEDFPSLTFEQIADARRYAKNVPPPSGLSYPKKSLKRLLRSSGFVPSE